MKLKYVAIINITAIILSSFTPAFADNQSEKLKERAVMLSDKEINLEDQEAQLNKRQAELNEFAKKLDAQKIEFSVREVENEEARAKLNQDSEFLAAQNKAFQDEKAEFENYRASVQKQAQDAERKLNDADEKLKLAQSREDKAAQREKELTERENNISDQISQINIEKAELLMLSEKTEEATKKLADLEKRENDLLTAQKIFTDEKSKIESERTQLADLRAEAERTITEAKAIMSEAEKKSRETDSILAKNKELESTIEQLRTNLKAKTDELDKLYQLKPTEKIAELPVNSDIPQNSTITRSTNGIVNWSDGSIRAKGEGVIPTGKDEAQGQILARRAAVADLQRNLLETIQGVQLDSKTTVEDAMLKSDRITTAVSGMIRGVEVVEENFDGKIYTVFGQIRQDKMSNAMSEIVKTVRPSKKPPEPKRKTGKFTGLIIDATSLAGIQPRKLVRILDEKGRIVYGTEYADRNIQVTKGLCEYFDTVIFRDNEQERVGNNPLKVKAQRLSNENADIVIPNWAADEIRNNAIDFRKECKVIIVKS